MLRSKINVESNAKTMKNEESQADVGLLEVQQKVAENALRLQENRQMMAQMQRDQEGRLQNLNEKVAQGEREHDRDMREIRKTLKDIYEIRKESDLRAAERAEEFRREMAERDEKFSREMAERDEKFNQKMAEWDENFFREKEEWDQRMRETDKKIKEVTTRFSSTTGHIIEGLMSSSAIKMYEDKGFKINSLCKNYKRKNKQLNLEMEQDVVLFTETQVIVEEVKASCDKKDVEKFFHNMEKFKLLYDEYADKEVFGAVAAVNYEDGADTYARDLGLFVVRVSSDEIFSLDPFEMEKLKRF